jgi:hypothetical protein
MNQLATDSSLKVQEIDGVPLGMLGTDQLQWETIPLPSTLATIPQGQVARAGTVRYTMKMKGQDPFRSFVRGGNQSVQSISSLSAVVSIGREGSAGDATTALTPSDSAPSEPSMLGSNRWMATYQPDLQTACRTWLGNEPHTVETAMARLAEGIAEKLQRDPTGKTLFGSSKLMRAVRADCFGQAVLLATAARACRIPAHVALGIASQSTGDRTAGDSVPGTDGTRGRGEADTFALHAWVEAWDGSGGRHTTVTFAPPMRYCGGSSWVLWTSIPKILTAIFWTQQR